MPDPRPKTVERWPALPYAGWSDTLATVHMWCQIVGKIRLSASPWTNHQWHSTLYVTPVGLTTSTIHHRGRRFDIEFDFMHDLLEIRTGEGERATVELGPMSVASFYRELGSRLDGLGIDVEIYEFPNEVENPVRFSEDTRHDSYDGDALARFVQALNESARVFGEFRTRFLGKSSPVHLFWGALDLAVTRFSGRRAPKHPGGAPGLPDWITREAYSHEVCSCGFWAGGPASPAPVYYTYAYPVPDRLGQRQVQPPEAFWSYEMGEFFLPYDSVRAADDPDATLLTFLQSSYEAVADLAEWNRSELEVPGDFPGRPS